MAKLAHPKQQGLSTSEKKFYQNITKLIVVRDPMERLVSAYLDKIAPNPSLKFPFFARFSWEVAKRYGHRLKDNTIRE